MSPGIKVWLPLAPAAVVSLYWLIGLVVFSVKSAVWGLRHDRELEARGKSILIGNFLKAFFSWIVRPLWRLVLASGISPNGITLIAMLLGGAAGISVASGRFALGGWLFLLSGILDTFDGRLARTYGTIDVPNSAASAGISAQVDRK